MIKIDIIEKLKNNKVDKNKKWIYNLIAAIIKLDREDEPFIKIQQRINVYYKQHYEEYYNKLYAKKTNKEKMKYNRKPKTKERVRIASLKRQREMTKIYNLYKTGKLSSKSIKIIEK